MKQIKTGQVVKFSDGKGGTLTGTVTRTWGTRTENVTIKTDTGRTFVRCADRVVSN